MILDFDFSDINVKEFGIGKDESNGQTFSLVPVDTDIQNALSEMVVNTWNEMQNLSEDPRKYEPSEKYEGCEYIYLPLDDDLSERMRDLHLANNLPMGNNSFSNPNDIFCYFVQMTDSSGRRLTAIRRATQFKGVLSKRLIRVITNSLKLITGHVFKLDNDFDFIVDSRNIYVLRPSGFEFTCKLQDAILAAVPKNILDIQKDIPFLDFDGIEQYAISHTRAARYLASIRSQKKTENIDKDYLAALCRRTGVEIREENGKIIVNDGHVMGLLEVL